jgi:hypothetical protein
LCKQPGHDAERCWKQCLACGQIHVRGQCKAVQALEGLKTWFKTAENQNAAGTMPAAIQQYLN